MGQNADEYPRTVALADNAVRVDIAASVMLGGICVDLERKRLFGQFLQRIEQGLRLSLIHISAS